MLGGSVWTGYSVWREARAHSAAALTRDRCPSRRARSSNNWLWMEGRSWRSRSTWPRYRASSESSSGSVPDAGRGCARSAAPVFSSSERSAVNCSGLATTGFSGRETKASSHVLRRRLVSRNRWLSEDIRHSIPSKHSRLWCPRQGTLAKKAELAKWRAVLPARPRERASAVKPVVRES